MSKPTDEERFNKAVDIYIKKYQLTIYSLIKFIEEKIAVTPQAKDIIVTEILQTKTRESIMTKADLRMYLHLVAAVQSKVDIRGKRIDSFHQFYRLAFIKKEEGKEVSDGNGQLKSESKPDPKRQIQPKRKVEAIPQIQAKKQKPEMRKVEQPTRKVQEPSKQALQKKKQSKFQVHSPKKELEIIQEDVIDENRTSNVGFRTQSTQELLLKMPEAMMMNIKSKKSVQITGYDKFGQNYLNPIIKYHIVYEEHSVYRRYSEFQKLMNDLNRRYEGFILPELPPKQGIKSNLSYFVGVDQAFLNERQLKLEEMLNSLINSKFVNRDEILEKFLADQDFEIEASNEGGAITYIKSMSAIAFNTKQLKNYGLAYYNYLKEFNKSQINTIVTIKYKEVESLLNICLTIDHYRNSINGNFEHRRDIFKQLKMDKNDRNLTITKFDKLSSTSASEIKNLSKEVNKYLELKSEESWLNYLIREKEGEVESNIEELKKSKDEKVSRIGVMQKNLIKSIEQLKNEKIEYLSSVGDKMIDWRKLVHP